MELESSSVSLLQEKAGFGAALGRHSITTRPFLAARTLFTGLCSNVGAQAVEGGCGLFITNRAHAYIDDTFYTHKKCLVFWSDIFWVLVQIWPFLETLFQPHKKHCFFFSFHTIWQRAPYVPTISNESAQNLTFKSLMQWFVPRLRPKRDSPNTRSSALAYMTPWWFSAMHWYIPESSKAKLLNLISFLSSCGKK